MTLREEIGGIIYDADIYKAKTTTGQLNNIVDDIMKEIEKRIDLIPQPRYNPNEPNKYPLYLTQFMNTLDWVKEELLK